MRIDNTVNKYLNEGKYEDFDKWIKTVESCKTLDQLRVAVRMGQNYYRRYTKELVGWFGTYLDSIDEDWRGKKMLNTMWQIIVDKGRDINNDDIFDLYELIKDIK